MNRINSEMIILAREARGYTQNELSELLGIAQGTLSKIEKGIQFPSDEFVDSIVKKLNYPRSFFEQNDKIYNPDLIYYRKRIRVGKKQIIQAEATMNIIRMNVERLLQSVDVPENKLLNWNIEEHGTPEDSAIFLRQQWNVPKGRIDNLTKLIEDHGIIVVEIDLEAEKMDGISMFTTSNQPIIFINYNITGDRQRLTLAHELGHLILHLGKIISIERDEEKEAMRFAGEFLIPRKEFTSSFETVDLKMLANQKSYWLVSMAAILVRSKETGMITDNQYKYLWQQMAMLGYKKREPFELTVPKEKPTLVQEILEIHQKNLGYTKNEISRMLNITEVEMDNLYYKDNSKLRIIRN